MKTYHDEKEAIAFRLRQMADVVEQALDLSLAAVSDRNADHARRVLEIEPRVDRMERETDDLITRVIAVYQPEENELRHLAGAIKVTGELERMADHAVSIADHAVSLAGTPPLPMQLDLARLAGLVKTMVHRGLDAYLRQDRHAAEQVMRTEQAVNAIRDEVLEELVEFMHRDKVHIRQALDWILITRKLERLADHATNVAEDVIALTAA
jgi:phosphate transport system protein